MCCVFQRMCLCEGMALLLQMNLFLAALAIFAVGSYGLREDMAFGLVEKYIYVGEK